VFYFESLRRAFPPAKAGGNRETGDGIGVSSDRLDQRAQYLHTLSEAEGFSARSCEVFAQRLTVAALADYWM